MRLKSRSKMLEKITISKEEYEKLKEKAKIDWQLVNQIKRSLEDIKYGRIKEWKTSYKHN